MTTRISPAGNFHPRNALTYAGLLLGLAAIAAAISGHPAAAGALIALAAIADTFDGRFAGLFSADAAQAGFGAELDSLCDACTFGLAPVVCTAALAGTAPSIGWCWGAGCLYLGAAVTRLAFYNVTHQRLQGFIGLPAPVAALLWSSGLCFTDRPTVLAGVLAATGVAMVSPLRIPRPAGAGILLFASWPLAVAAAHIAGR